MNYYSFHVGDYLSATAHLDLEEEAIYMRLLNLYYQTEQPILNDPTAICRQIRARGKEELLIAILAEFFTLDGEHWVHARCERELEAFRDKSEKARKSVAARIQKQSRSTDVQLPVIEEASSYHRTIIERSSNDHLTNNQEPITNNQIEKITTLRVVVPDGAVEDPNRDPLEPDKPQSRGYAPPDCPLQAIVAMYHEVLPELPRIERMTETRKAYVRQRWREWASEKRWRTVDDGLDEWRKFFRYIRGSPFLMGRAKPREPGKSPFIADLEWLMKPTNHVKVFEGKYHEAA